MSDISFFGLSTTLGIIGKISAMAVVLYKLGHFIASETIQSLP